MPAPRPRTVHVVRTDIRPVRVPPPPRIEHFQRRFQPGSQRRDPMRGMDIARRVLHRGCRPLVRDLQLRVSTALVRESLVRILLSAFGAFVERGLRAVDLLRGWRGSQRAVAGW